MISGALLALLVAVAFWPVVSGRRSFFHLDLRYEHLPVWSVTARSLAAGESPFWIDGEHCGQPALFVQEAPLFYPVTYPLLRTGRPVERLADLFSLFHIWLAGFTAFLLLRELAFGSWGPLFGAVAWMLSARMVQSTIWPNAVAVCSLLPLLLLGIFRIGRGARRSGVLIVAIAGALILLASRPQAVVGAAPIVLAASVAALGWRKRGLAWAHLAIGLVVAAALAAPSLLTTAALYPETSRAGGLTRVDRDLLPIWFGQNLDQVFLPVDGPPRWPEAAAYPGILAGAGFLLGLVGLLLPARWRDPAFPRAAFAGLAIGGAVGLLFAVGERGPYALFAGLPVLRGFRVPARFLISWSLAVALGSGLAVSTWTRRVARPGAVAAALLIILAVDLSWHALSAAPTAPPAVAAAEPPLVQVLRPMLTPDETGMPRRFWSLAPVPRDVVFPDGRSVEISRLTNPLSAATGMRFGLESVQGGGPPLERIRDLFRRASDKSAALGSVGAIVLPAPAGHKGPYSVARYEGLPRLLLAEEAVVVPETASVPATLEARLDPRKTAVLEEGDPMPAPERPGTRKARALERRPGYLRIATESQNDAVLVVLNSYERGWSAVVDGESAPVLRADGAFQGVRLSPGRHEVLLRYVPPGLKEGIGLALAGVLGLVLAMRRLPTGEVPW
ncbi:MAG: YfhO family protein [Acidobacteriota bacterium]|nr:YfhO family protein [Acidobacteriota bacterium]